ncbi:hypothetical protein B5X24_HaOG210303 [Helicoverpa armigera]|nr:hypothetical protein B5X24_HaOG210303 [Helicoverpa armigera]
MCLGMHLQTWFTKLVEKPRKQNCKKETIIKLLPQSVVGNNSPHKMYEQSPYLKTCDASTQEIRETSRVNFLLNELFVPGEVAPSIDGANSLNSFVPAAIIVGKLSHKLDVEYVC